MLHIILYRPEKPQNTGNIMRTCVAIHAKLHIIGPLTFSIDSKDLKRVGMDYIDDLKMLIYRIQLMILDLCLVENPQEFLTIF